MQSRAKRHKPTIDFPCEPSHSKKESTKESKGAIARQAYRPHPTLPRRFICQGCGHQETINEKAKTSNLIRHLKECRHLKTQFLELVEKNFSTIEARAESFAQIVKEVREEAENKRLAEEAQQQRLPDLVARMVGRSLPSPSYPGDLELSNDEHHTLHVIQGIIDGLSFSQMASVPLKAKAILEKRTILCAEAYRHRFFPVALHFARYMFRKEHRHLILPDATFMPIVAVATDGWTSRYNNRSVSIVLSSIDWEKTSLLNSLAGMSPMSDSHTSTNLSAHYNSTLRVLFQNPPRIGCATTDNAANESGGGWLLASERIPCSSHTFQLWLRAAFLDAQLIKQHTRFALKITSKLAEYPGAFRTFCDLASRTGVTPKRPPTYSKSRWWTEIPALSYFIEMHYLLQELVVHPDYDRRWMDRLNPGETEPDLRILKLVEEFLLAVKAESDHLEAESTVTSVNVLPFLLKIDAQIQKICSSELTAVLRPHMEQQFISRFQSLVTVEFEQDRPTLLSRATSIDPRSIKNRVIEEVATLFKVPRLPQLCLEANVSFVEGLAAEFLPTPSSSSSSKGFDLSSDDADGQSSFAQPIFKTFERKAKTAPYEPDFNIISFWKDSLERTQGLSTHQRNAFFRLFELLLSPMASQTSVERVFSVANRCQADPRRGHLLDSTLCDQVFIQRTLKRNSVAEYGELFLDLRSFFNSHPECLQTIVISSSSASAQSE